MKTKIGRGMGIGLIALSAFFLFDPKTAFMDFLPDAIGYLLLCLGLHRLSDLSEDLGDCLRRFRILLGLGVVQLALQLFVYVYLRGRASEMNVYELPVAVLLCSFLFLLTQIFLAIPAFRHLFSTLSRFAERTEGVPQLQEEKKGRTVTERLMRRTTVALSVISICSILPELTVLTTFEAAPQDMISQTDKYYQWYQFSGAGSTDWFDWYPYVSLFRIIGTVIASVFGILWLCSFWKWARLLDKDTEWKMALWHRYEKDVLSQTGMMTVRRVRFSFICFFIGAIFTISVRFGHYALFPTAIGALAILIGMVALLPLIKAKRLLALSGIPFLLISIAQLISNVVYLKEYVPMDSLYRTAAYTSFLKVRVLGIAEALAGALVLAVIYILLRKTVKHHTGVQYEDDAGLSRRSTEKMHRALLRKINITAICFLSVAIANGTDAWLQAQVVWLWLPSTVLAVVAAWSAFSLLQEIYANVCIFHRSDGVNKSRL